MNAFPIEDEPLSEKEIWFWWGHYACKAKDKNTAVIKFPYKNKTETKPVVFRVSA